MMAVVDRERRRIERDLHDGTQQRLTSIVIKLELLRDLVGTELKAEVDDISRDAATAIDELRRLVHGMYPRGLHEGGLSEGLRMLARGATLPVSVIHRDIERCDPAVEAAVYFCVAEAVQNASKHAGAGARVTVTLERNEHNLTFEVADDGVGFDTSDHASGLGLLSLRDRIEAIGGKLTIDSTPGKGTVIRGMTPNGLATQFALRRSSVDPPNSRARTSSAPNLTADGR